MGERAIGSEGRLTLIETVGLAALKQNGLGIRPLVFGIVEKGNLLRILLLVFRTLVLNERIRHELHAVTQSPAGTVKRSSQSKLRFVVWFWLEVQQIWKALGEFDWQHPY